MFCKLVAMRTQAKNQCAYFHWLRLGTRENGLAEVLAGLEDLGNSPVRFVDRPKHQLTDGDRVTEGGFKGTNWRSAMNPRHTLTGQLASGFIESKLTLVLMIAALIFGIWAVLSTPREENPQISMPAAAVQAVAARRRARRDGG